MKRKYSPYRGRDNGYHDRYNNHYEPYPRSHDNRYRNGYNDRPPSDYHPRNPVYRERRPSPPAHYGYHDENRYKRSRYEDAYHRYDQRPYREKSPNRDDSEGHYNFRIGETINDRYKVNKFMGEGTFAKVVECYDMDEKRNVAIKIIRSIQKYTESAQVEIDILKDIKRCDRYDTANCIRLIDSFLFKKHMCLVFPLYGSSLYEFIKRNDYRGFSLEHTRKLAYNLLSSIKFLHSIELVHTDLKPENILFVNSDYYLDDRNNKVPYSTDIRVIDFGSATYENQHHTSIISTRHYRAPEVILGLGWSYPADIWSIGCIIVELYTGDAMFQTHENREHLALMQKIIGQLPPSMTNRDRKYFDSQGKLRWPQLASSKQSESFVEQAKPLTVLCDAHNRSTSNDLFYDLISKMLQFEPRDRLTAKECLEHEFFS